MGGELRLVAEFPNRPPVVLKGLLSMSEKAHSTRVSRHQKTEIKPA
jgi:hypothetical protein